MFSQHTSAVNLRMESAAASEGSDMFARNVIGTDRFAHDLAEGFATADPRTSPCERTSCCRRESGHTSVGVAMYADRQ
jgi:hypothetical protein